MTTYRDRLIEDYNNEIGSVVGCGLDRLECIVSHSKILHAVEYYEKNRTGLNTMAIGDRRREIANLFS